MPPKGNHKLWKTRDFERRFREAMGRDMTSQEREFFGLAEEETERGDQGPANERSDRAQFAWQALRRISSLLG